MKHLFFFNKKDVSLNCFINAFIFSFIKKLDIIIAKMYSKYIHIHCVCVRIHHVAIELDSEKKKNRPTMR